MFYKRAMPVVEGIHRELVCDVNKADIVVDVPRLELPGSTSLTEKPQQL